MLITGGARRGADPLADAVDALDETVDAEEEGEEDYVAAHETTCRCYRRAPGARSHSARTPTA